MIVLSILLISGCQNNGDLDENKCVIAGCSGQVCTTEEKARDLVTTCEYKEEYKCLEFTNCGFYSGRCAWELTDEYLICLEEVEG